MQGLHHTLRNLVQSERGNVGIIFGLTSLIAVASVGGSVDYGRTVSEKAKLQQALDAAVVSAIAGYRETGNWQQAQATAAATFQAVYTNADVMASNLTQQQRTQRIASAATDLPVVSFTQSGSTITGTANMKVNTPFIRMFLNDNLKMAVASSGTPPTGRQLEVALMVDLTGSMGWAAATGATAAPCNTVSNPTSKIDYLKCAGEDLLNILLPTSGANNATVRIGVAPFSDKVNAGAYAAAVTGLAATGGTYANISNLASTKQGPWSGTYQNGLTTAPSGQATGSQYGAQGYLTTAGSTATGAGATFSNSYCASPTYAAQAAVAGTLVTTSMMKVDSNNHYVGRSVTVNLSATAAQPTSVLHSNTGNAGTATGRKYKPLSEVDYYDGGSNDGNLKALKTGGAVTSGYYVPVITSEAGLTKSMRTADGNTGPVGVYVPRDDEPNSTSASATGHAGIRRVGTSTGGVAGYWKVTTHNGTDWTDYTWRTTDHEHFVQVYDSIETGATPPRAAGTHPGCESPVVAQPQSKLITCVTERKNGSDLDYTAVAPVSGNYVGPYNHGSTTKSNYSSDGKCWAAGRELPAVIPLTNNRDNLENFFETATVGGATAGHLGTAWASYLLSPDWSSVWPADSTPTAYNTTTVKKAAILMTDGEYNIQFSTASGSSTHYSAKQALMLCKQMRDQGIHVYTVGFGFAENAAPPTTNIEGMSSTDRVTPLTSGTATTKALDMLAKCASSNSSYKFPYDGQALRQAFKDIANGLATDTQGGTARLTN